MERVVLVVQVLGKSEVSGLRRVKRGFFLNEGRKKCVGEVSPDGQGWKKWRIQAEDWRRRVSVRCPEKDRGMEPKNRICKGKSRVLRSDSISCIYGICGDCGGVDTGSKAIPPGGRGGSGS